MRFDMSEDQTELRAIQLDIDKLVSKYMSAKYGENVMATGWAIGVEATGYSREGRQFFETEAIIAPNQGPSTTRGLAEAIVINTDTRAECTCEDDDEPYEEG